MTNQMNVKEAERRAQSRAVDAELKIMEQEQARAEEQARQSELARRERDSNIENMIINQLQDLKPLYAERQKAYDRLATALDDFMQIERQIMPELVAARDRIPNRSRMPAWHLREKWVTLALRGGIPSDHSGGFVGGSPLAKTVAWALVNNVIIAGQIAAGKSTLNVTIE